VKRPFNLSKFSIAFAAFLLVFYAARWLDPSSRIEVTTTRLSPDETRRARLTEVTGFWSGGDRKAAVQAENLVTHKIELVLSAGFDAMGQPPGTERFVWSKDGTKFLLVGRHFFVEDDLTLATGDQVYLLHDVITRESWVNSDQNHNCPPLTANLITGVEFTEPVVLKPRPKVDPDSPKKRE